MADSIHRIVPTSVPFDRTAQPGKDGKKKSEADKRKQDPGGQAPPSVGDGANKEPAEPEQDKGKNLDISA